MSADEARRQYDELFAAYEALLPQPLDYRTASLAQKALNLADTLLRELEEVRRESRHQHGLRLEQTKKRAEAEHALEEAREALETIARITNNSADAPNVADTISFVARAALTSREDG